MPPHNFCHPALSQCNVLQDDDFFLPWSIVCYTWPHPPLPRAWKTSWKIVSLVRQLGISRLTACAPPLLNVQLMKQPKKGVPKNSTFLKYQVSEISERCTLFREHRVCASDISNEANEIQWNPHLSKHQHVQPSNQDVTPAKVWPAPAAVVVVVPKRCELDVVASFSLKSILLLRGQIQRQGKGQRQRQIQRQIQIHLNEDQAAPLWNPVQTTADCVRVLFEIWSDGVLDCFSCGYSIYCFLAGSIWMTMSLQIRGRGRLLSVM